MPTISAEVYDAFREAGASEEASRKAAEAVAILHSRRREMRNKCDTIVLMHATNIVLLLMLLGRVYLHP